MTGREEPESRRAFEVHFAFFAARRAVGSPFFTADPIRSMCLPPHWHSGSNTAFKRCSISTSSRSASHPMSASDSPTGKRLPLGKELKVYYALHYILT